MGIGNAHIALWQTDVMGELEQTTVLELFLESGFWRHLFLKWLSALYDWTALQPE